MEYSLIVNKENDVQEIIKVKASGSYFDKDAVVWDERKDGPIPQGTELGGLEKQGSSLIVNPVKKAAHDSAMAAIQAARQSAEQRKAAALAELKSGTSGANTVAGLRAKVQAIIDHLGIE